MRFPEFGGEWEREKLRDKCSFYSGGTPSSSNKSYYNGEIPFIRSGEISGDSTELFLSEFGLNNSSAKMVDIGDLLLALYGATSGQIAISKIRGAINQAILCIKSSYDNIFLKSVWEKHVDKILQAYLQGGQGNLSADIVKNLSFYFPSLDEQNKISKLIVLIDERIATQNKIIEDLKKLKVAITNNIISSIAKKSIYNTLDRVADIYQPQTIPTSLLSEDAEYYVYGANGIIGKYSEYNHCEPQICIACRGNSCGTINFSLAKSWITGNAMVVNTDKYSEINKRFLYHYLSTINFNPLISGSGQPQIVRQPLAKLKVPIPSIKLQADVVKVIDSFEQIIENENKYLQSFLSQKNYLLSNMFI